MTRDWAGRPIEEPPHPAVERTARAACGDPRALRGQDPRRAERRLEGPRQRHRLPLPPGLGLLLADRVRRRRRRRWSCTPTATSPRRRCTWRSAATSRPIASSATPGLARSGSGARRGLEEARHRWDIATTPRDQLEKDLVALAPADVVALRGYDAGVDVTMVAERRGRGARERPQRAAAREGRLRGRPAARGRRHDDPRLRGRGARPADRDRAL